MSLNIQILINAFLFAIEVLGAYFLWRGVCKIHYWLTACKPILYYLPTRENKRILEKCRILGREYYPTWFLWNGHFQTILLSFLSDYQSPTIKYERDFLELSDSGVLSLDWAYPSNASSKRSSLPILLVLHGLTGGSQELYIRSLVREMIEVGWRVVVMNARGCSATPVRTAKTYCAAYTEDLREVVKYIRPLTVVNGTHLPFVAVGYSLGSNILVKYLGEEGESTSLTAAMSIGNPFDLMETSRHLERSVFHRWVYNYNLAKGLKQFVVRICMRELFSDYPMINADEVMSSNTVKEFDNRFTRHVFGYKTVDAYYRDGSSNAYVLRVRIPLLVMNAMDDPISTHTSIPYDECKTNPYTILATTARGGHLAFFHGSNPMKIPKMWISEVVKEYCQSIRQQMNESNGLSGAALLNSLKAIKPTNCPGDSEITSTDLATYLDGSRVDLSCEFGKSVNNAVFSKLDYNILEHMEQNTHPITCSSNSDNLVRHGKASSFRRNTKEQLKLTLNQKGLSCGELCYETEHDVHYESENTSACIMVASMVFAAYGLSRSIMHSLNRV